MVGGGIELERRAEAETGTPGIRAEGKPHPVCCNKCVSLCVGFMCMDSKQRRRSSSSTKRKTRRPSTRRASAIGLRLSLGRIERPHDHKPIVHTNHSCTTCIHPSTTTTPQRGRRSSPHKQNSKLQTPSTLPLLAPYPSWFAWHDGRYHHCDCASAAPSHQDTNYDPAGPREHGDRGLQRRRERVSVCWKGRDGDVWRQEVGLGWGRVM